MNTSTATTTAAPDAGPVPLTVRLRLDDGWHTVCEGARLLPGRGVAALLPGGAQAALFLDRTGRVYATDNRDPFTGAAVLSRGLTGSADGVAYVASPLLKQRFALATGRCLDVEGVAVRVYEVRVSPAPVPESASASASAGGAPAVRAS